MPCKSKFKDSGGYQYESDTRSVFHGMRFYPDDYEKSVNLVIRWAKNEIGSCQNATE